MNKKTYVELEFTIVHLDTTDIVTSSPTEDLIPKQDGGNWGR